jgi:hypothetical protein
VEVAARTEFLEVLLDDPKPCEEPISAEGLLTGKVPRIWVSPADMNVLVRDDKQSRHSGLEGILIPVPKHLNNSERSSEDLERQMLESPR